MKDILHSLSLVLCSLFFLACDSSALQVLKPPAKAQGRSKAQKEPAPDPDFSCKQFFWARSYSLVSRLAGGPTSSFARLTAPQKKALARLIQRSEIRHKLKVADGRILVTMPRPLAPPRTRPLELLLAEDLDRLVVFSPQRKLRFSLPLHRLPDVLDGVARTRRTEFAVTRDGASDAGGLEMPGPSGIKTTVFSARLSFNHFPDRKSHKPEPVEQNIHFALMDGPTRLPRYPSTLLLALPLLVNRHGLPALESLAFAMGRHPISWAITTTNQARASQVPATVITRVFFHGHVRVPRCELAETRKGYRDSRTLLRRPGSGLQQLRTKDLAGLRNTKARSSLDVVNTSTSLAYIHVDGALLGWVAPGGGKMSFKGLPEGFYRVYARSPLGIRTWGPLDMYVPGPLTLK